MPAAVLRPRMRWPCLIGALRLRSIGRVQQMEGPRDCLLPTRNMVYWCAVSNQKGDQWPSENAEGRKSLSWGRPGRISWLSPIFCVITTLRQVCGRRLRIIFKSAIRVLTKGDSFRRPGNADPESARRWCVAVCLCGRPFWGGFGGFTGLGDNRHGSDGKTVFSESTEMIWQLEFLTIKS